MTAASGSPTSGSTGHTNGGAGGTFTQVYAILTADCAGCHSMAGKPNMGFTGGKLDLSTQAGAYTNLVGAMAMGSACMGKGTLVVAGNSAMSVLYSKVAPANVPVLCGTKMPHGKGPKQTMADVALIKAWIDGGEQNN